MSTLTEQLEKAYKDKSILDSIALRRYELGYKPIYTSEMDREYGEIEHRILSLCEAIRAANASEALREAEKYPVKEVPLH